MVDFKNMLLVLGISSLIPSVIYLEEKMKNNNKDKKSRGFYLRVLAVSFAVCYYLINSCNFQSSKKTIGDATGVLSLGKLLGAKAIENVKDVKIGMAPF